MKSLKAQLEVNSTLSQRRVQGDTYFKTHNSTRDLGKVFGYETDPTIAEYRVRFDRQNVAKRVVKAYPDACWSKAPIISDDTETTVESTFELAVTELSKSLKLVSYIQKTDILSRLGQFALIFIGVKDGLDTDTPMESTKLTTDSILYLKPYSQANAGIKEYDVDPASPRFGLPLLYTLYTGGFEGTSTITPVRRGLTAHWTRVIHIAEGALENDIVGEPVLEPILDLLHDLLKITGGSAESFWLNSRGGLSLNAPAGSNFKIDQETQKELMTSYTNNQTRLLTTQGMDVKTLNYTIADPRSNFDMIMTLIATTTGIPKRILMGAEQGELASSQDEKNWFEKVRTRQETYCEPGIVRPLIDWFIQSGVLPKPHNDTYEVTWHDLAGIPESEIAVNAERMAKAMLIFSDPAIRSVMSLEQIYNDILKKEFKPDVLEAPQEVDPAADPLKNKEKLLKDDTVDK